MLTDIGLPARLEPLLHFGEDRTLRAEPEGWRDYVTELDLTLADVPALVAVLDQWINVARSEDDSSPTWCAPIHAWRALGQLGAVEAAASMLAQLNALDDAADDWSLMEWPTVFAMIGPPAAHQLYAYISDSAHGELPRAFAVDALRHLVERHQECRKDAVAFATQRLALHEPLPNLNASLAGVLVDLNAAEAAETIERAFAADVIDESMYGGWGEVRQLLGVEGLGLAPLERRPHWWTHYDALQSRFDMSHVGETRERERKQAKREKAKRKAAAKARKRNRR
jgi:hypothetical protein